MNFTTVAERAQMPLQSPCFQEWVFPDGTPWTRFYRTEAGYLLRFPELADFQVSYDGRSVCCWPVPGVSEASVQQLYLNQVLPLAQSKHGKLVFHASAVEIDGKAVAFIGESGKGKSTLAASFATNGFRFLTDDGLVVELVDGESRVMPSHPSIRLWEDSQEALIAMGAQTAPPVQFTSKARFLAGNEIVFCEQSRSLGCAYFLGETEEQEPLVEPMNPGEALIELVKHSFLLDVEEKEMLAMHFDELSNLVQKPIFYRLNYPRRFEELSNVRRAIVQHASKAGGEA